MATTSTVPSSSWYNGDQQQQQSQSQPGRRNSAGGGGQTSAGSSRRGSASTSGGSSGSAAASTATTTTTTTTCPPPVSSFPDKFQDFFAALKEDCDDLPTMLEDKLIPRKGDRSGLDHLNFAHNHNHHNNNSSNSYGNDNNNSINNNLGKQQQQQRWSKRAFQRRSSEIEVRPHRQQASSSGSAGAGGIGGGGGFDGGPRSPTPSRRRSSSIAVARPTPDLHRFLQAETGPWGHLSPQPRSPSRTPSSVSPASQHLSPAGPCSPACPSPTSPSAAAGGAASSRLPPRQRGRTSSMPAVPRHRPMLADTRRGGGGPATSGCGAAGTASGGVQGQDDDTEDGVEYYRLRSFSITANGVFNLGDSLKSRRSRSINSVTSSGGTSCSSTTRDARLLSSTSQLSGIETERRDSTSGGEAAAAAASSSSPQQQQQQQQQAVASYKVGMLGASGVGKTALTAQFTTSEYICAYDASLDDEYGQKSVSVMIDGQETELEIIDHPATEMSVEAFCSTYNPDVYVVVYSVVDRASLKYAEDALMYLWKSDYMAGHGVILVGNKVDLERKREVPAIMGRRVANACGCKFIETSSGLAHHVDELLVGILAQIKLNPQRDRDRVSRRRRSKQRGRLLKHLLGFKRKTKSCENLFVL